MRRPKLPGTCADLNYPEHALYRLVKAVHAKSRCVWLLRTHSTNLEQMATSFRILCLLQLFFQLQNFALCFLQFLLQDFGFLRKHVVRDHD